MAPSVNLLEHLRSKTQVDCDCLDTQFAKDLGPFIDCTSNQADSYTEFLKPERAALLKKSVALARQIHSEYPNVTFEELAVELSMVSVSLTMAPLISGAIHVMANPMLSYSTTKVIENGQRIANLCHRLDPNFDMSRLCIKIPSTWEALQACRKLKSLGIKTLATTLFTMEQAILAAEVGCVSISPFVHELKVHFDETYHDSDPIFGLCVQAQQYYEQHSYATRVKACSLISVDEVMRLSGVAALTLPPPLLYGLRDAEEPEAKLEELSLFTSKTSIKEHEMERKSFVNDEAKYREAFSKSDGGKGLWKTTQAIELFNGYQIKAEELMKKIESDKV